MFKIASAILLSCMIGVLLVNPAWAVEDFMLTINSLSEYEEEQFSVVNGKTMTLHNIPVENVLIHVYFPSGIIKTSTNSTGQFSVTSPIPVEIGEHNITVYAKKDNKYTNAQMTYQVVESKPAIIQEIQKPSKTTPKENDGNIKLDPFSKMIKQLEEQKTDDIKREISIKKQQQIDEQRRFAKTDLQKDLKESEQRNESHNPRNAFYKFLQKVDSSVRGIFWQQFLFTEMITKQAHDAKENALEEGKSSFDAMKIFQKEAAVTQKEVMDFNKNLSIQYGNSTSDIQNLFDKNGKLPRED